MVEINSKWQTFSLCDYRERASAFWRDLVSQDPLFQECIPSYVLDRYAFALWARDHGRPSRYLSAIEHFVRTNKSQRWEERRSLKMKGFPELNLHLPNTEEPFVLSSLISSLVQRWMELLTGYGIQLVSGAYEIGSIQTWGELYRHSSLFPQRAPAIPGPTFFPRLSKTQQSKLMMEYGPQGIMDFFAVVLFIHEETHRLQHGEPMFCEFLLANLWCRFLDDNDLWDWQLNDETGQCSNVERPWVYETNLPSEILYLTWSDTANISKVHGQRFYFDLCALAFAFDNQEIPYAVYLSTLSNMFQEK